MDSMYITIGVLIVLLGFGIFLWKSRGGTVQKVWGNLKARIRFGVGAPSLKDQEQLEHHIKVFERNTEGRLKALEKDSMLSHQLDEFSRIIDRRLQQLEQSEGPGHGKLAGETSRPRSIVRHGLRFTLSDALWSFVGMKTLQDMSESQLVALIQGPFCRMCLKRMGRRSREQTGIPIPPQCAFCGVPWQIPDTQNETPTDIGLKRELYEFLDQERRTLRDT